MPRLLCPCGFTHNLSAVPDDGWNTIRDKDYEGMVRFECELQQPREADDPNYAKRGALIRE